MPQGERPVEGVAGGALQGGQVLPRLWGRGARAKVLKTASRVELRKSRRERMSSMARRCRSRQLRISEVGLDLAARQRRT